MLSRRSRNSSSRGSVVAVVVVVVVTLVVVVIDVRGGRVIDREEAILRQRHLQLLDLPRLPFGDEQYAKVDVEHHRKGEVEGGERGDDGVDAVYLGKKREWKKTLN